MSQAAHNPMDADPLRRRSETRLGKRPSPRRSVSVVRGRDEDTRRLLQELQVHHVELEMQNAQLQEARDRTEALLEKYTDLYDFAPVGYFSLDEQGRIVEANLAGAALLEVERSQLLGRRLTRFLAPASRTELLRSLEGVFAGRGTMVCESSLLKPDGSKFWVNLHAALASSTEGPERRCRVAVSDLTVLKQAEQAHRRLETLAAANRELRQEIVRREAVEAALRLSEQKHRRLLKQAHRLQEQLRHLSHGILQAQEDERKRISRELHDDITQTLVGINVHLETLARQAAINPTLLKARVARTQRVVEKLLNIIHQFARELRPTALDDLGLTVTLRSLLKDFMKRTGIRVRFSTFAEVEQLDNSRLTVLYRVVQSALANVAEHAHASQVKVSLRRRGDQVRLEISDNGRSFSAARVFQARRNKHLGLLGMRERVEMVGGHFTVESAPGRGTTIQAVVPFGHRGRA